MILRPLLPLIPFVACALGAPFERGPQVVLHPHAGSPDVIVAALKKAKVFPDVLPAFVPKVSINLLYEPEKIPIELGNTIPVSATARPPLFSISPLTLDGAEFLPNPTRPFGKTLTLVLTSGATSKTNPAEGQMCHWIYGGIRFRELNTTERLHVADPAVYTLDMSEASLRSSQGVAHEALGDLVEYMQPAPQPKTNKHQYVFVLLEAEEGVEEHHLTKPSYRLSWGYKHAGQGVSDWAAENGLVPVGVNFFYAQAERQ